MALPVPDIRSNLLDLSGRTGVVTGAVQGTGFAFGGGLASVGSAVVIVDMSATDVPVDAAMKVHPLSL